MRQIYWRKRLADIRKYWLSPPSGRSQEAVSPRLMSERLEERIVLAAPVAVNDTGATDEDNIVSINVRSNDSDPDNDSFNVTHVEGEAVTSITSGGTSVILDSGARVALLSNGNLRYNPAEAYHYLAVGESTTDSFTYTIEDANGETASATVEMTINGVNDLPVGTDRSFDTDADQSVTISLRGGTNPLFEDVDTNDTLTYFFGTNELTDGEVVVLHPANPNSATITYDADTQTLLYNPGSEFRSLAAGAAGSDTFNIRAEDGEEEFDTAAVTINLTGVNDSPTAVNNTASTNEETAVSINVVGNDSDPDTGDTLTVTHIDGTAFDPMTGNMVTLTSGATVTRNADGTLTYNPGSIFDNLGAGESDTDSFDYTISDGNGGTATATVDVTINGLNDPPAAADDTAMITEDATVNFDVVANDSDPDAGTTLTVIEINGTAISAGNSANLASGATVTLNNDGTLTYNPAAGFHYLAVGESDADSFTYTISDGNGGEATATVNLTITGVNDPPVATDRTHDTDADATVVIPLRGGVDPLFADVDTNDTLTYFFGGAELVDGVAVALDPMTPGSATITYNAADQTLTYNPGTEFLSLDSGEVFADTFAITARDGSLAEATADVTVNVTGINAPPTANDDTAMTTEDDTVDIDVVANDTDPNAGDTLTVVEINGTALDPGDTEVLPSGASVTLNLDGTLTYNPGNAFQDLAAGESDTDSFTYTISDGEGGTATATVDVTVSGVNDPPIATDRSYDTDADATVVIPLRGGVDPLFVDVDANDTLTYFFDGTELLDGVAVALDPMTPGSATITYSAATQTLVYNPGSEFVSLGAGDTFADLFSITARDPSLADATADVTVNVTGVNDAPTAVDDSATTTEDDTVNIDVVDNDFDPDTGDVLTVTHINGNAIAPGGTYVLDAVTGRSVTLNLDGTLTYDPGTAFDFLNPGQFTFDFFAYTISDGEGGTATANVSVTITGVNDPPVAVDDIALTDEDTAVVIDVVANDIDADAGAVLSVTHINGIAFDPLTGNVVTLPNGATVTLNPDGTLTYNPGSAFQGLSLGDIAIEEFEYTLTDQFGATSANPGTVSVTVTGANDPPVGINRSFVTTEDDTLIINLRSGPNALFSDPDVGDTLIYFIDMGGVPVPLVDGVPLALDPLNPNSATVTLNAADGTLTYDPRVEFDFLTQGEPAFDFFVVLASDGLSATATSFVDVLVVGVNDPPQAVDDDATTDEDTAVVIDVLGNDIDPDTGAVLQVTHINGIAVVPGQTVILDGATGKSVTLNLNGTLTYDPGNAYQSLNPGDSVEDTFEYTVADEIGAASVDPGVVTVTITGLNDPPVAVNDSASTDENTAIDIDVLDNDTDVDDGATLSVSAVNGIAIGVGGTVVLPSGATVTRNADGTLTYDPGTAFDQLSATQTGNDSFNYALMDQTGAAAVVPGIVNISIEGLNDVPVVISSDLNVFRNLTLRQLHHQLAPGTPFPAWSGSELLGQAAIVEGETVRLPFTIYDPDNGDRLTVQLYLVAKDVFDSLDLADPASARINSTTPGVILLDWINGLQANSSGDANATLSATLPDDFPLGTPSDEYVFVLQFSDSRNAGGNDAVTEPQFDTANPEYTIFNHTPFLNAPGLTTTGGLGGGVLQPSIEFVLIGNEFEATVKGFVLDASTSRNEAIFVTLIDNATGRILTRSLQVQTTSLVNAVTRTIDSDGNVQNETVQVGRLFTARFRTPVTSNLVNISGTQLQVRMVVEDDDGGESSLTGLTARFPAFVLPPIEMVETEVEVAPVIEDVAGEAPPSLTIVRRFERTQTPLSGKIETDSFEALVRIVVSDGEGADGEPLYQYIELFGSQDEDEAATIDVAGVRLEQFLQQISKLPDNRYQIVLRQSRGELIVTDTVILDVIVVDGEIIERHEQSRIQSEPASEVSAPQSSDAPHSSERPFESETADPAGRAGSVALPLLALAEFRRRRRNSPEPDAQHREPLDSPASGAPTSVWSARFRRGARR